MRIQDKLLLGLVGGAGALWATRAYLRSQRRIALHDRVVVVTGATSGLGLLIARHAAENGASLAIAARDASDLKSAAADLRAAGSPDVLVVPTDVSKRDEAESLIARTVEHFGRLDILINNAGIMVVGPVEEMTAEDFERVMAVNYWGSVYPTLAALPIMRRQQFGRIGNVVSVGGKIAMPHLLPYTGPKFAMTGFSEGLRAEVFKDNIYVTAVYPGTIRTGGHTHAEIKGNREAEYAWFSLSDTIPGLSASAHRCARAFWDAVLHGDPELVFGLNAKLGVALHNLSPAWFTELSPLINAALPKPTGQPEPMPGGDLRGTIANAVNRMVPRGTRPEPA